MKKFTVMTWILLLLVDVCMVTFWFVDVDKWVEILLAAFCIILTVILFLNAVFELSDARKEFLKNKEEIEEGTADETKTNEQ